MRGSCAEVAMGGIGSSHLRSIFKVNWPIAEKVQRRKRLSK